MDLSRIASATRRPAPFEKAESSLWTEPYIASRMLEAHLDPNTDAASRRPSTILKTVGWIEERIPAGSKILDLGCGPGLYCEVYAIHGHRVTGIDFSENSIRYAREHAALRGLGIEYLVGDYLDSDLAGGFDLATMIYCDMGTLGDDDRDRVLGAARRALKSGGLLVFDVFGESIARDKKEGRTWSWCPGNGFWTAEPHLVLDETFHFEREMVFCDQHLVVTETGERLYRSWDRYYTKDGIVRFLEKAGFGEVSITENLVDGSDFTPDGALFVSARRS